jgi:SAM-dependent methyltransferase
MPEDDSLPASTDSIAWYDLHAGEAVSRYEALDPDQINDWVRSFLPSQPGFILDVGAGSGRDAAWLASDGHEVIAVEPSEQMRTHSQELHAGTAKITWINDRLPGLEKVHRLGVSFDFILLNAVWMHVPPASRQRAFRKLITLLKPGGRLAISFRQPDPDRARSMFPCHLDEFEKLARDHGSIIEKWDTTKDEEIRPDIEWTRLIIRLPDDGTGALPVIRHIILRESKSSTYKLALLRVLARIAEGSLGLTRPVNDQVVGVPLGLVAVFWLRQFKLVLQEGLPQMPNNVGIKGLGFVKDAYRRINHISPLDFRVAARFTGQEALFVHQAIRDAAANIKQMPATYTSFPDGLRVYGITPGRSPRVIRELVLDADYLRSFGELLVPESIWRALTRLNVWIEPALVAEWIRIMKDYLVGQGRKIDEQVLYRATRWTDPERDVRIARDLALELLKLGRLYCVWTEKKLTRDSLDIDHCFPWSAWPCGDLWNLLPADRSVNQRLKSGLLPSGGRLAKAREMILDWWDTGYLQNANELIGKQFITEASASLPGVGEIAGPEAVFDAMEVQRLRLHHDQQVPEWEL